MITTLSLFASVLKKRGESKSIYRLASRFGACSVRRRMPFEIFMKRLACSTWHSARPQLQNVLERERERERAIAQLGFRIKALTPSNRIDHILQWIPLLCSPKKRGLRLCEYDFVSRNRCLLVFAQHQGLAFPICSGAAAAHKAPTNTNWWK